MLFLRQYAAGIVDPLKVVRCALADAGAIASLMTTTEAAIVEMNPEESETPKRM